VNEEEILNLIDKGCSQSLELIKEPPMAEADKKELAKIMAAFANSADGIILIGVDKNTRTVVGINSTYDFKEIARIDEKYCSPAVSPKISLENIRGKQLIYVSIVRGANRPYYAEGDCYVRVDKQVFAASHNEIQNMYKKDSRFNKQSSDSWPVETARYEDLDKTKIDQYLKNIGVITDEKHREKTLKDKGILIEAADKLVPTAAGMLMFGNDPQYFLISSGVRLVKFQGKNIGSVILDQKEVKGTIPEMIDESWKFIFKHMNMSSKVEGLKREDFAEYPAIAVREAIANAIVHRDYSIDGSQVRILIFDDRIEVYTPGGLAPGVTVANMEYTQYSRNKFITQMLMNTGQYIEKLGAGIKRIKLSLRQNGLREPILFDTGADFILTMFGSVERQQQLSRQDLEKKIQRAIAPAKSPQEIASLLKQNKEDANHKSTYINSHTRPDIKDVKKPKKRLIQIGIGIVMLLVLVFALAFNTKPRDPLALYHRASVLHNRGNYREAIYAYSEFLNEFPDSEKAESAQYYLAGCMDILGEDVSALNAYAKLLQKYPKSRWVPYAYYWRGGIFLDMGELDNAIAEYQKLLKGYPGYPITLSAMRSTAVLYYKQKKFKETIDMYQKILDAAEASSDGYEYYQMSLCYIELGQKDKAREMLKRVISSEKSNPKIVEQANEIINKLGS